MTTKGEKLIWELFLMVRELMPATPDNTARQTEWARVFHELEHHDDEAKTPEDPPADLPDDADEDEHPAAHAARKRKKK